MKEIWKHVKGYEGRYKISNHGRVISIKWGREIILNPGLCGKEGKRYYQLVLGQSKKSIKVHRLVATHFLENPDNKPCINHKDSNKLNNRADNLEFCTYLENNQHSIDNGNRQRMLILNTETGIYYEYMRDAAKAIGVPYKNLHRYLNGTRKSITPLIIV